MKNILGKHIVLKYLMVLIISIFYSINFVNSQTTQTYGPGTSTWICPIDVNFITVKCWGAGGGGGNSNYSQGNGGGGGGGGSFSTSSFPVVPGNSYYISVGYGGNFAGASSTVSATSGQPTWFSFYNSAPTNVNNGVLSAGGFKGINAGGGGGGGSAFNSIGTIKFSGGAGSASSSLGGGGGGSSAGLNSNGLNGSGSAGGIAPNGGGNGGGGSVNISQGQIGSNPGGGGGGSDDWQGSAGGNGGNGQIILTYTPNCFGSPELGIISMFPSSGCGNTTLTATLLSIEPGISYQWQNSSDNITWSNIIGAVTNTLAANSNSSMYYRIRSICAYGDTSYSNIVYYTFTTNPAQPAPVAIPSVIECGQSAVLNAIGGGTSNYTWFSDSTGISQVATGNSFTTPNLNASTNYYVASNVLPQYQQTYLIPLNELVNLTFDCGNGSIFGSGIVGFNWTDVLPQSVNVLSVTAELSIGSECAAGLKTTTLNGISQSGFSTTANCSCNGNSSQTLNLAPTNYVKNGANQFRVTNASSFGFNSSNIQFTGYFARITVNYTIATPCYSNLTQVPVTIIPASTAGTVSANQTICVGSAPSGFSFTGISGSIQWQTSSDSLIWSNISGATTSLLSSAQIGVLNTTTYYHVIVVNSGCNVATSQIATIVVVADPTVSAPTSATYCQNASPVAPLSVTVNGGTGTISYQWYSNAINSSASGTLIMGATNNIYTPPVSAIGTTYYYCLITQIGANCSVTSATATIVVAAAPTFSTQPLVIQTICLGGMASSLNVTFNNGTGMPLYQWFSNTTNANFGGTSISGATFNSYSPPSSVVGTTYYYCVISFATGGCSVITSATATVNVNPDPAVSTQPLVTQTICVGGSIPTPLSVSYSGGTGAVSYQWFVSGTTNTSISGATSVAYTPALFTTAGTYNYLVEVALTGIGCNTAISQQATIVVVADPTVSAPTSAVYCQNASPVTPLSVAVTGGTGTISYQWYSNTSNSTANGTLIAGATNNVYTPAVSIVGTLYYYCIVSQSGANCSVTSQIRSIQTTLAPVISAQPLATQTICLGGIASSLNVSFNNGTGMPLYQWYSNTTNANFGGTSINGATTASYLPSGINVGATYYYCIISFATGGCSVITSQTAVVIVNPDPIISSQPLLSQTICQGTSIPVPITVSFSGGAGIATYQWFTNNGTTLINNAILSTYTPGVINTPGAYTYQVVVTLSGNGCETVTSQPAEIIVNSLPLVSAGPDQTVCAFDQIVLTGSGAQTYSWSNGVMNTIPFTITSSNTFTVIGTDINNCQNSDQITINVTTPSIGGTATSNQNICLGGVPSSINLIGFNGSIQWQNSIDNVNWNNIIGAIGQTLSPAQMGSLSQTSYYRAFVTNGNCLGVPSSTVTITISPLSIAGTVSSSQIICSGTQPSPITLLGNIGTILWYSSPTSAGPWTIISGATSPILSSAQMGVLTSTKYYRATVNSGICASVTSNVIMINVVPQSIGGSISSSQTICAGTSVTLNLFGNNGSIQWEMSTDNSNFSNISSASTSTLITGSLTQTTYYRAAVTSGFCSTVYSSVAIITVNSISAGVISSNQTICSGSSPAPLVFSSLPIGLGTFSYLWQYSSNGITSWLNVPGGTTSTLSSAQMGLLTSARYYRVIVTSTLNGVACPSISNIVQIAINNLTAGEISSDQTFCNSGDPSLLSFTTLSAGSGALANQWQSSIDNFVWTDLVGETSIGFDPTFISSTIYYRVLINSNLNGSNCVSPSNVVTVFINNPNGGIIGSDQTICSGSIPTTFTVQTAATGLGILTYSWESSNDNLAWTTISGATLATYNSGILSQNTYFRRKVTATLNGIACSAFSNTVLVTINLISPITISANQTICSGSVPTNLNVITAPSSSGALTYQWQTSTNGAIWTNISGAISATLNSAQMGSLFATRFYRLIVYSTLNGVGCASSSNSILVSVNNVTAGTITATQTVCSGGDPTNFTSLSAGTGSGVLTYQWQSSINNIVWNDIVGVNSLTYNPSAPLIVTTYYRRAAISILAGVTCTAFSNTLIVNVNNINAGVIGNDQTVCSGGDPLTLVFSANPTGSGVLSYQWQSSINGTNWTTVATSQTFNPSPGISNTTYYRVNVISTLNGVACIATSNTITITVNSIISGTIGDNQTFCLNGDAVPIIFNSPSIGSGFLTYQWQNSMDNVTWSALVGETTTNYDPPLLATSMYYNVIVNSYLNSVNCTSLSNVVTVFMNNPNGGIIGSDQTICSGSIPTIFSVQTAATGLGILTYSWESSTDNLAWTTISGATLATFTSGALTQNTYFRRKVTATLNSLACSAFSNTVLVTINLINPTTISANQTICSGSVPTDLNTLTLPFGSGTLTYQWQISTNGAIWTNISGAISATLNSAQMGSLFATRFYRLIVYSTLNGVTCSINSNTNIITVNSVTGGTISGNQTICSGGNPMAFTSPIAGTGTGILTYQWQYSNDNINWINVPLLPIGTVATYNADPITTTTFYRRQTIYVLNSIVCAANSNILTVLVNQINAGVIGSNQTICSGGDPVAFSFISSPSGSGTLNYQWESSSNGTTWSTLSNSSTFDPSAGWASTTYFILNLTSTLNSLSCSTSSNIITVAVNNIDAGIIGSNQTICLNDDPALISFISPPISSGTNSFQWFSSNNNISWTSIAGANQNNYDPPALSSNSYYKVVVSSAVVPPNFSDSLICQSTSNTIAITLNSFTPGIIGSNQSICSGGDPAIFTVLTSPTGLGIFSYQWQYSLNGTTWTNLGVTTSTYNVPVGLTNSTYYRRLTSHNYLGIICILPTNTVFVGIYSAGTVNSSQSVCIGSLPLDLTLTGSVGNIQWQTSTNGTIWTNITGATNSTLSASQIGILSANKYYRATITGVTCSPTLISNSILITVLTIPIINAGFDQTICSGNAVVLSGSGGITYAWNNGVLNNMSFTPTSTMTYTLTGTAANGCTNTDQVMVNVNPTPTVVIMNNNPVIICQGQSFTLSSSVTNGFTYQWKRNGVNISGAINTTYTGVNNGGNYTLTVTSAAGCFTTSSPVNISITVSPTVFAGADQHICVGESIMLSATSTTPVNWSGGITNNVPFSPTTTMTYYVSTVNTAGCQDTDSTVVFVHYPTSSIIYTSSLGNYNLNGSEIFQSGVYSQTINNQWGCDSTITLNITIYHVGLSEIINDNIIFYPNPSIDGLFNFAFNGSSEQISCRVFNATGQLIQSFDNLPQIIDLTKSDSGVYFIEIITVDLKSNIKAIKL
jgi:hypothetical protein